jgi:hypothetical protein
MLAELTSGLNEVRISLGKLETVVRMSIAEQRRINEFACRDVEEVRLEQRKNREQVAAREEGLRQFWSRMEQNMETRIRRLDNRFAFFAGGVTVLVFIVNVALRYFTPGR